jgi:hypothetical protein
MTKNNELIVSTRPQRLIFLALSLAAAFVLVNRSNGRAAEYAATSPTSISQQQQTPLAAARAAIQKLRPGISIVEALKQVPHHFHSYGIFGSCHFFYVDAEHYMVLDFRWQNGELRLLEAELRREQRVIAKVAEGK